MAPAQGRGGQVWHLSAFVVPLLFVRERRGLARVGAGRVGLRVVGKRVQCGGGEAR